MPLTKLKIQPGIVKDDTAYSAEGRWIDSDKIRFWNGRPQKIGGWSLFNSGSFIGICRGLHTWRDNAGNNLVAIGTNTHLYVIKTEGLYDVTPSKKSGTLAGSAFAHTSGSKVITATHSAHGMEESSGKDGSLKPRIVLGAITLGGQNIAANTEFEVTIIDGSTYTFEMATNAGSTGTGGGTVSFKYLASPGPEDASFEYGWGVGIYQAGGNYTRGWSQPASEAVEIFLRTWTFDNFGEDLIASFQGGPPIYWDASDGIGTRAFFIDQTYVTANTAYTGSQTNTPPAEVQGVFVSTPDRHLVCFGADDPMSVQWSDQETIATWTKFDETNTAGRTLLSGGTRIIGAKKTRGQTLIFTDNSIHSMVFQGPPYTFGFREVASKCGLVSPQAVVDVNGIVYWMSYESFFVFDGSVRPLPNPVNNYVFNDFNHVQANKVVSGINKEFSEIWWFYPTKGVTDESTNYSAGGLNKENNRYVKYNFALNCWDVGTFTRTAWADQNVFDNDIAADAGGYIYKHEDGTSDAGSPINAFVESGEFDIGDGDQVQLITRILPDISITDFTTGGGTVRDETAKVTLKSRKDSLGDQTTKGPFTIRTRDVTIDGVDYAKTPRINPRIRGRQMSMKIESDGLYDIWRLGDMRLDVKPDGER